MRTPDQFSVGEWAVDLRRLSVARGAERRRAEPKVLELLAVLASRPGYVWTREELLEAVWPDTVVLDHALTRTVSELRRLLDDSGRTEQLIETIPKRGYRLAGPVRRLPARAREPGEDGTSVAPERSEPAEDPTASHRSAPGASLLRTAISFFGGRAAILVAVAMGIGGLAVALALGLRAPAPSPVTMRPVTASPEMEWYPSISRDGAMVTYVRSEGGGEPRQVFVHLIEDHREQRLTSGEGEALWPRFPPDGNHIAFQRLDDGECSVLRVPLLGGPETHVAPCPYSRLGWDWSPTGDDLVFPAATSPLGLVLHSRSTGTRRLLTRPDGQVRDLLPAFSPDGTHLAFARASRPEAAHVYVLSMTGDAAARRLTPVEGPITGITWGPDGQSLIVATRRGGPSALRQIPIDGGPSRALPVPSADDFSMPAVAAATGRLVLMKWAYDTDIWEVSPSASTARPVVRSTRRDELPTPSPSGDAVAFVSDRSGGHQLWLARRDGAALRSLAAPSGNVVGLPAWAPDGQSIAVELQTQHGSRIGRVTRRGHWTWVTDGPRDVAPVFSADGRTLYFGSQRSGIWQIWARSLPDGAARMITRNGGYTARPSRDGATLFVQRMDVPGLWRVPRTGEAPRLLVPDLSPAPEGAWTVAPDGGLLVQRAAAQGWAVEVVDPETGHARPYVGADSLRNSPRPSLAVGPDQTLWFSVRAAESADIVVIDGAVGPSPR